MSNILQTLLTTYQQNPAAALSLLPDLFQAVEDGKIVELPCKPDDAYWHRDYDSGGLELNFEMHDLEEHDEKYRELDCCAFWE